MIRSIFKLITAKRTICHGMKVRMKRVSFVGFVAKNDSRIRSGSPPAGSFRP